MVYNMKYNMNQFLAPSDMRRFGSISQFVSWFHAVTR